MELLLSAEVYPDPWYVSVLTHFVISPKLRDQRSLYNPPDYSVGSHVFFSTNLSGLSGRR